MGWRDVYVLPEAGDETGEPGSILLGTPSPERAVDPSAAIASDNAAIVDLSPSPNYRRGHIPGAWFAIRSRLERALAKIAPSGDVILTSEDGVLASFATAELQALTNRPVYWIKGGNAAWTAAGFPLSTGEKWADEPVDAWLKPYERRGQPKEAMNEYLTWEVDLLDRIQRDGTTHFLHAR
jgi:rhodanese-related sulfurtransferase